MIWLIETTVFNKDLVARMASAIRASGAEMRLWDDAWWHDGFPDFDDEVFFYGSLGNASRLASDNFGITSFCNVEGFKCSTWYPHAEPWLLNRYYEILPARSLVEQSDELFKSWQVDQLFVRPDSPLKPFSGRLLEQGKVTLADLDHGFYYDDENLPVLVSPAQAVEGEWRFVVSTYRPITGSAYLSDGRTGVGGDIPEDVWDIAKDIALELSPPDPIYVMDLCMVNNEIRLLELNPFSGADLYHCDAAAVAQAVRQCLS